MRGPSGPTYARGPISAPMRPEAIGPADGRAPGIGGLSSLAKSAAIARSPSTFPLSPQSLATQGNRVRQNFNHYDCFRGNWWDRHAGAWLAARWAAVASSTYWTPGWYYCYSYCGYSFEPYYYDYGSSVIYERDYVYINGDAVATQDQYADQAMTIAETGKRAEATDDQEWLPLGVFAMIQGDQGTGNFLFQLAVNRSGVLRGNYYNALSDTTVRVCGSVDQKSQRAAWTLADRKEPVFEAGFANLTRSQTTMLAHYGGGRTQQWTLVRIEPSASQSRPGRKADFADSDR